MSEEEVRNAAERLQKLLRAAQYPQLSALHLEAGDVSDLLRVLHFVLLDSSRVVAQFLVDRGYDLYGKTDARFVESSFRLLRDEFRCFPSLSVTQFLSRQFVARRLVIVADAAAAVAQKRQELQRAKRREEAVWSQPQQSSRKSEIKPTVENHVLPNHAANILQHLKQTEQTRSETPVHITGVKQTGAPSVPMSTGRQAVRFVSESECNERGESFAVHVDEGVQTDSRHPPQHELDKLGTAIAELSRQLNEMSSALMGKMSSVENRLGRLEDQMHDVQVIVEGQRNVAWESDSAHFSRTGGDAATRSDGELSKTTGLTGIRRTVDVEPPCAWPPQPSVFERAMLFLFKRTKYVAFTSGRVPAIYLFDDLEQALEHG